MAVPTLNGDGTGCCGASSLNGFGQGGYSTSRQELLQALQRIPHGRVTHLWLTQDQIRDTPRLMEALKDSGFVLDCTARNSNSGNLIYRFTRASDRRALMHGIEGLWHGMVMNPELTGELTNISNRATQELPRNDFHEGHGLVVEDIPVAEVPVRTQWARGDRVLVTREGLVSTGWEGTISWNFGVGQVEVRFPNGRVLTYRQNSLRNLTLDHPIIAEEAVVAPLIEYGVLSIEEYNVGDVVVCQNVPALPELNGRSAIVEEIGGNTLRVILQDTTLRALPFYIPVDRTRRIRTVVDNAVAEAVERVEEDAPDTTPETPLAVGDRIIARRVAAERYAGQEAVIVQLFADIVRVQFNDGTLLYLNRDTITRIDPVVEETVLGEETETVAEPTVVQTRWACVNLQGERGRFTDSYDEAVRILSRRTRIDRLETLSDGTERWVERVVE